VSGELDKFPAVTNLFTMKSNHESNTHDHKHVEKQDGTHGHHHEHQHSHVDRSASRKALAGALVVLAVFFVVEVIGGLLTNSLALLSDAAHLLTDVAAVALALIAQWFANRPPSAKRSFGYRRVEIIAALFNGLTLWLIAVFICIEGIERISNPPEVDSGLMIIIAVVGAVAQAGVALILARASGESLNVRGAYVHAMTDAVQSVGVVIAGVVIYFTGFVLVDPIISIVISVMIIWSGGKIVVEAVHVLLEGTPPEIDTDKIIKLMLDTDGVAKVADLHVWCVTSGYNALSAHVISDEALDANDREELTSELSDRLSSDFPLQHLTLQVEKECEMEKETHCGDWIGK
jgi:cobalt-zinc-cadmium efflux system protein